MTLWPKSPNLAFCLRIGLRRRKSPVVKTGDFRPIRVGTSGGACGRRRLRPIRQLAIWDRRSTRQTTDPVDFGDRPPILKNRRPQNRRDRGDRLRRFSINTNVEGHRSSTGVDFGIGTSQGRFSNFLKILTILVNFRL